MALSDDQRAMLRLLAQREQGYEDMAALMGVSVEELRSRVKDALTQLEREGEAPPSLPDPPAAEPQKAPPPPEASPEPPELSATPPSGAVPPALPPSDPRTAAGGEREGRRTGKLSLSSNGTRVALAAIAGAVAIVVVLLLVLGGGSGSDSSSTSAETNPTTTAEAPAENGNAVQEAEEAAAGVQGGREVTKALLTASGGGEGRGVAIFGRVKNKLALQIVAEGLGPLGKGESYAIWIAQSPQKMLPLAASPVSEGGTIASQFEVPTELLGYLANETFDEIAITKASNSKLNVALEEATEEKEAPAYTGTEVMRGKITGPIIGAAQRLEEEKGSEGEGK